MLRAAGKGGGERYSTLQVLCIVYCLSGEQGIRYDKQFSHDKKTFKKIKFKQQKKRRFID